MKKIIALGLVVTAMAATTSFGQGYFQFTSGKSQVYDTFTTPGTGALDTKVDVALYWGAASTTPLVDSIFTSTAINGSLTGSQLTTAWTDITTDPNFTLAINAGTSAGAIVTTAANGSFSYNGGTSFGVNNTSPGNYTIFEVSWNAAYASPSAAATAGSAVGWSAPIQYTAVNSTGFVNPTLGQFASFGTVTVVPEPGTMALAGLGGLSLLAFRRKK